ncbi:MAG: 3-deoxy-D-manno-octulosonic acid transferase [Pyrinomonadaceae bacterium]
MYFLYSCIYTIAFILLSPYFLIRYSKYLSGVKQRLGFVPKLDNSERKVVWIHCVSVGEVNAARPLIDVILKRYSNYQVVISTTTATGQKHAKELYGSRVTSVIYFPYDWKNTVKRTLSRVKPKLVLIMETEIWFRFYREASKEDVRLFIVNGRISEKSAKRYSWIRATMKRVLKYLEIAMMQDHDDATRLIQLGIRSSKVKVTGNMKFDQKLIPEDGEVIRYFRERFGISKSAPLIVAASTHGPEESLVLTAFKNVWKESKGNLPRLLIAPRHPERFNDVETEIRKSGFDWVRRTEKESNRDKAAEIILLDSIGELREIYPISEIVFVGGSILPRGGQNILEPAFCNNAIVTGPHMENFAAIAHEFILNEALEQLPETDQEGTVEALTEAFSILLNKPELRKILSENALMVANRSRGATEKTLDILQPYFELDKPPKLYR